MGTNRVSLELSGTEFVPGDQVDGIASFQFASDGEVWIIEFVGYEKVEWTETMTFVVQGFTQTYIQKASGTSRIAHAAVVVSKPNDALMGQACNIPFSFTLPSKIPGSAPYIHYHVIATITDMNHAQLDGQRNHSVISVTQESPVVKRYRMKTDRSVRFLLCCNRGQISCRVSPDKPFYNPGDVVKLPAIIHNRSKVDLVGVKFTLVRLERLTSDEGISKSEEEVILKSESDQIQPTYSISLPSELTTCVFGKHYVLHYALDIHIQVSRGNGPTLRLPIIVVPRRRDEAHLNSDTGETDRVTKLVIPPVEYSASFSLSAFPNVEEIDELSRSESRLSKSWSMIKTAIKSTSKIFSTS